MGHDAINLDWVLNAVVAAWGLAFLLAAVGVFRFMVWASRRFINWVGML